MNQDIKNKYDKSFPSHKKVWRQFITMEKAIGWKSMYFMILDFQKNAVEKNSYKLRKSV